MERDDLSEANEAVTTTIDTTLLARAWVHAHEEDHDGMQVFRPLGTQLPPSRGRRVIDLSTPEVMTGLAPGADDRPESFHRAWTIENDVLRIRAVAASEQRFRISRLASDELALIRLSS